MKTLIQVNQLHKSYGSRTILDDASVTLTEKQKIGVIGRNGAGKSTLFRIITGGEQADSGGVVIDQYCNMSHLEQVAPFKDDETVLDFLMRSSEKEEWQKQLKNLAVMLTKV